jgi:apolipoprotein N-acyltransferase
MVGFPLVYGIFYFLVSYLFQNKFKISNLLVQSALWVLLEIFIVEKLMGFPLSLALTNFQNESVIQLASLGGIHFVSFLIFMSNASIVQADMRGMYKQVSAKKLLWASRAFIFFLGCYLISTIWGYTQVQKYSQEGETKTKVSLIQPNISQYDLSLVTHNKHYFSWQLQNLFDMSFQAKETFNPDIVIWPESVLKEKIFSEEFYYPFRNAAKDLNKNLIVHSIFWDKPKDQTFSSAIHYREDRLVEVNHKHKLVPIFESDDYAIGKTQNVFFDVVKNIDIGSMICFEMLFSKISSQLYQKGANVLLCISNNGYFGKSSWPLLHAAYSTFRSAEFRRPFIFINNTGFSIVTNASGKITHISPFNKKSISNIFVSGSNTSSFYAKYPQLFTYACISVVFLVLLFQILLFKIKGGAMKTK